MMMKSQEWLLEKLWPPRFSFKSGNAKQNYSGQPFPDFFGTYTFPDLTTFSSHRDFFIKYRPSKIINICEARVAYNLNRFLIFPFRARFCFCPSAILLAVILSWQSAPSLAATQTGGEDGCTGAQAATLRSKIDATVGHKDYSKRPQPDWIQKRMVNYQKQFNALGCQGDLVAFADGKVSQAAAKPASSKGKNASCSGAAVDKLRSKVSATVGHKGYSKRPQPDWIQKRMVNYQKQFSALGCQGDLVAFADGEANPSPATTASSNSADASCSGAAVDKLRSKVSATVGHKAYSKRPQPDWIQKRMVNYQEQFSAIGCQGDVLAFADADVPEPDVPEPDEPPIDDVDTAGSDRPASSGQCVWAGDRSTFSVVNQSQLVKALGQAKCGDAVTLGAGVYAGGISVQAACPADRPLVLKTTASRAKVTGRIDLNGSGITVSGIDFHGHRAGLRLYGKNHRVIANRFSGWAGTAVWLGSGRDGEVAYNEFAAPAAWGWSGDSDYPLRIGVRSSHRENEFHYDAHIHHNHFRNFPGKPNAKNYHSGQSDAIEVCATGTMRASGFLVEHNLIERHLGGNGLIDVKCSAATVRDNTLVDSPGGRIDLRYGENSVVERNWIENSGGSVIRGGFHKVIGNVYQKTTQGLVIAAGNDPWNSTSGQAEPHAYKVHAAGNQTHVVNVGETYGSMKLPARDTVVERFEKERILLENERGTKILAAGNRQGKGPVRLRADKVGPDAACRP